jgi:pentapeptide MXKDX repeat protein
MKKTIARVMAMYCLAFSLAAWAQGNMGQDNMKNDNMKNDNMKNDNMKNDHMAMGKKTMSITGKISDDGKMFVGDKDSKSWTITNPEAVKGHEGHHVTVKAHVDAAKNEIHVVSLKTVSAMKDNMKNDSMSH